MPVSGQLLQTIYRLEFEEKMVVPIISYGHAILRSVCQDMDPDYPGLKEMIIDLTDTLDAANGVGLAAPQINKVLRMFIVDTQQVYDQMREEDRAAYFPGEKGIKETFINARIIKWSADTSMDSEGCLSIPTIVEEIERNWCIEIEYYDKYFKKQIREFSGITARAIQHEIDHTDGILSIDHLSPLKKKLLESKLKQISEGKVITNYTMKYFA